MTVRERVEKKDTPKKILALDGGGIRGLITIEILAKIEEILRVLLKKEDLVLADYFDFVAGTSTGAIIATCISLGMPIKRIKKFYLDNKKFIFKKSGYLKRCLYSKYTEKNLSDILKDILEPKTTLGSEKLKTLLMIVMQNATTDSPWPITNNPFAKYNQPERREKFDDCNLDLPLWQLARASSAAPTYFPAEELTLGKNKFLFVDGGVTTYNNPAFMAFLNTTVQPYNINWPVGEENLLLVSIGTGHASRANIRLGRLKMHILYHAFTIPFNLMFAALTEQDMLCRVFGKCLIGDPLDNEIGDLIETKGPITPKMFTYLRYDVELTRKGLDALRLNHINPKHVLKLDSVKHIDALQEIGRMVANKKVREEHFYGFLQNE